MSSYTIEDQLKETIRDLEDQLCTMSYKLELLEGYVDNYEHLYEAEGLE